MNPVDLTGKVLLAPAVVALMIVLLLALPGSSLAGVRVRRWLRRVAERPVLAAAFVGLIAVAACLLVGALHSPEPDVQDEFSFLLAGDTFSRGRLTNPPVPVPQHFAAAHVLVDPTYQSKYPPAQGMALALGSALAGRPLLGVWLSLAAASVAVWWVLRAFGPSHWALAGGLMTATHAGMVRWWGGTYLGGGVAMLGGALVLGSVPRLLRSRQPRHALVLVAGLALLANSRPFEGLLACVPALGVLAAQLLWRRLPGVGRVLVTTLVALAAVACWMAYYNWRVTGDPLRIPYLAYQSANPGDALLVWQKPEHAWSEGWTDRSLARRALATAYQQTVFYFGLLAPAVLLTLPWLVRRRGMLLVLGTCLAVGMATLATYLGVPRYSAPLAAAAMVLMVQALRILRAGERRRGGTHRWTGRVALAAWSASLICVVGFTDFPAGRWSDVRAEMESQLGQRGGQHLVLVRYVAGGDLDPQWVYNGADLDTAPVIWARELKEEPLWELLDCFPQRQVWLLDVGASEYQFRDGPDDASSELPARPVLVALDRRTLEWNLRQVKPAAATVTVSHEPHERAQLQIHVPGRQAFDLQLERRLAPILAGEDHTVGFEVRSDPAGELLCSVSMAKAPWSNLGLYQRLTLSPDWQPIQFSFTSAATADPVRLHFDLGTSAGVVELGRPWSRPWRMHQNQGARGLLEASNAYPDAVKIGIDRIGTEPWSLQLTRAPVPLAAGRSYRVTFRARAAAPRPVIVGVSQAHDPWRNLGLYEEVQVGLNWQLYSMTFAAPAAARRARLHFDLGQSTVSLEAGDVQFGDQP